MLIFLTDLNHHFFLSLKIKPDFLGIAIEWNYIKICYNFECFACYILVCLGFSERLTPWGFVPTPGIFISRLLPNGLAASTNLLNVNDEIVEVNGIEVSVHCLECNYGLMSLISISRSLAKLWTKSQTSWSLTQQTWSWRWSQLLHPHIGLCHTSWNPPAVWAHTLPDTTAHMDPGIISYLQDITVHKWRSQCAFKATSTTTPQKISRSCHGKCHSKTSVYV